MGSYETELNLSATELRLGLPGTDEPQEKRPCSGSVIRSSNKRSSQELEESRCKSNVNSDTSDSTTTSDHDQDSVQPAK